MLVFKSLRAGYNGMEKLHGISAEFQAGTLNVITGLNGCGKSTLLKCAAGLLKPFDGCIELEQKNLYSLSDRKRAQRIAYMPQSRSVPEISVEQLVLHGRYPHLKWGQNPRKADREIVENAIERVHLQKYIHENVNCLSGGERQRAYIAMMLAQQAPLMLLDEPTTHLDIAGRFDLMELLRSLSREGRCVIVVLHDLSLALKYADTLFLMQEGICIASDTPDALVRSGAIQRAFSIRITPAVEGAYLFEPQPQEE